MGNNDRFVSPRPDGRWADQRVGSGRAAGVFDTQREAIESARDHLRSSGGGELNIQRPDGRIRDKDTVGGAPDSYPPKG